MMLEIRSHLWRGAQPKLKIGLETETFPVFFSGVDFNPTVVREAD